MKPSPSPVSCSYIFLINFLVVFVKENDPLRSPLVTIGTNSFKVHKFCVLPTECTYVIFTNPRKKKPLLPYTVLPGWFLGVVYKVKKERLTSKLRLSVRL
jgi:hypothetical protein